MNAPPWLESGEEGDGGAADAAAGRGFGEAGTGMTAVHPRGFAVHDVAPRLELADEHVVVAGDWHGNVRVVQRALPAVRGVASTMVHVGDFGLWDEAFFRSVDYWAERTGIERILVVDGNHEHHGKLRATFEQHPGGAVRLSTTIWALPRGYRFGIGGRDCIAFGGAASVDYLDRVPQRDWWPEEAPTDEDVKRAIEGGPADVMFTHEAVDGSGVGQVEEILAGNPLGWPAAALEYSQISRRRVSEVWQATRPRVLLHGHIHVRGTGHPAPDMRVESLAADTEPGNLVRLDLSDLAVSEIDVPPPGSQRSRRSTNVGLTPMRGLP